LAYRTRLSKKVIDAYGEYFYCRYWEQPDEKQ
jgi:hypothetical protein